MAEFHGLARVLIASGLAIAATGVILLLLPKLPWLGRLPGDVLVQRPHATFFFPLGTCLLFSLVGTLVVWVVGRFFR